MFVDTSAGFRGDGSWTTEDGKLCSQLRGSDRVCNEMRIHNNLIYALRVTGEVVQYTPK